MTPAELAALHPRLYHVTLAGAWATIRDHGLWATAELVRHLPEEEQRTLTAQRRAARVTLAHPRLGTIAITDNIPIHMGKLGACLDGGLSTGDWLRMLNARVFFWPSRNRALGLARAAANTGLALDILNFDTARLAMRHLDRIEIAPINTGNTYRKPVRRGLRTFTPIAGLRYAEWRRARSAVKSSLDSIAEIVVRDGVPDIADYFLECETVKA